MNREQRLQSRNKGAINQLNEFARSIEKTMRELDIPTSQRDTFLSWAIGSLWDKYKEERMNKRLIIENEIKNLGIRLANGTVKKEYHSSFELPSDKISNVQLVGLDELGLTLEKDESGVFTVSGKPNKAGDFSLKLTFNTIAGEDESSLTIPIAFNPNPRDLWKNIPTDKNIPYYKDDCANEYIKVEAGEDGLPKKDIVAASQRGRSHAQEGKARDDHFKLFHCPDSDWYIIAVADGAGSAKYSRKGSWVACDTVVEHCKSLLSNNQEFEKAIVDYNSEKESQEKRTNLTRFVYNIVFRGAIKAHEAINAVADKVDDAKPKDFATTLMFAICKKYEFGWFIASFWVGDGAMCLYDETSQTAKLLGVPDEGEFSGQTRFLTMPEVLRDKDVVSKRLRMAIVPDFTALFLMSDGVSDPMFETDKNLNDFTKWKEFYENLKNGFPEDEIGGVDLSDDNEEAKDQLLNWLDFWSPGNHDDRTIAILY
jgi:serine/threonine protein phosphatase PrpC